MIRQRILRNNFAFDNNNIFNILLARYFSTETWQTCDFTF